MADPGATPSARQTELLEAAYRYVLDQGLGEMSLRPLATAIGSSPRVLLYLFGSKDGLIRALLERARTEELRLLSELQQRSCRHVDRTGLAAVAETVWAWLSRPEHRALLILWAEAYTRSLIEPDGPWAGFARATVEDWLLVLGNYQPADERDTVAGSASRTMVLALLRGALLDLLATGDLARTSDAVCRLRLITSLRSES